jgi:hypothetical protein
MSASPPSNSVNGSLPVVLRALLPFLISQAYVVWLVASSDIDGFQAMVMYVPEVLLASFSSAFLFSRSADVLANRTRQFLALLLGSFVLLVMLLLACTPPAGAENADQQPGERMLAYARQALSGDLALRGSIYLVISFAASLVQAFASADPQRTWYDNVVRPAFIAFLGIFLSAFLFLTGGLGIAWPVVLLVDGLSEATRHWLGSLCLVLTFIALRVLMIWFSRWRSTPEQRDQDYQAFLAGEG